MNEKNPLVFVVDDDASIRDSLKDLIGSAGLEVQTFASAQEFLNWPSWRFRFPLFSSPAMATSR